MNRFVLLPVVLAVLPCLAFGGDPKDAEPAIEGTWQMVSGEVGGAKFPERAAAGITLTLKDGTYEVMAESADRGTVTYNTSAKPKAMDIKGTDGPNKGKTFPAIYELTDDKLTVCYDLSGTARPKEFKSLPKSKLFLATYKRKKP